MDSSDDFPAHPSVLRLPEAQARRLLLAQALDTADPQGVLVGLAEREAASTEALLRTGDPARGQALDVRAWLLARADALVGLLAPRRPALAALAEPAGWDRALHWVAPLAALVAGFLLERIASPHEVNLLSPPLLGLLTWSLLVYLLLALGALRGLIRPAQARPGTGPWRRWSLWRGAGPGSAGVVQAFQTAWWRLAGPLLAQRGRRLMHLCAAAWGVGVLLSVLGGGLVRAYQVGWESTLLDAHQVQGLLQVLHAPVVALFGLPSFSLEEIERLRIGVSAPAGLEAARRWLWMTVALLLLVVVLPRLALAGWAHLRARRLAGRLEIDLRQAPFERLLASVLPTRLRLLVPAGDGRWPAVLWRQLTAGQGDRLTTDRGDLLLLTDRLPADAAVQLPGLASPLEPGLAVLVADAQALATPRGDGALLLALQQLFPEARAGLERLHAAWAGHDAARTAQAMDLLAEELLAAAADAESAQAAPVGLRQLVLRGDRAAMQQAHASALARLAARWDARRQGTDAALLHLLGLDGTPDAQGVAWAAPALRVQHGVHAPQAGLAGAAGGAAMGATVDLVTGGLTLGAASALGAVLGGGAALAAAAWRNRGSEPSALRVQADAAVMAQLTVQALLRWDAAWRRDRPQPAGHSDPQPRLQAWAQARAAELAPLWSAPDAPGARQRLAVLLTAGLADLDPPG